MAKLEEELTQEEFAKYDAARAEPQSDAAQQATVAPEEERMWARQEEPRTCQEQEEPRTCQEARWVRALGAAHTAGGAVCLPGDAKSETRQRLRRGGQGSAGGSSGGAAAHNTSRTTRTGRTRHGIIHRHRHQHTVMGSAFFHAMPDLGVKLTDDKFPAMTNIGEKLTYEKYYLNGRGQRDR